MLPMKLSVLFSKDLISTLKHNEMNFNQKAQKRLILAFIFQAKCSLNFNDEAI
jgi:hypothetical protein